MSDRSRPVLKLVSPPDVDSAHRDDAAGPHHDDLVDRLGRASHHPGSVAVAGRPDVTGLRDEIAGDVARLADRAGPTGSADLQARWDAVARLCDPADLDGLAAHARSLHEAAESVRRQHLETAEDLGPLWDTWEGPAAEAVQDRVSALARSAHALVVELETTADRLGDAYDDILDAVETLADDLAQRPSGTPPTDLARPWDEALSACGEAWESARRVLAGQPDVSRSEPRFP